ncbi:MAG: DUF2231 domain-containing protein [Azospirillaceae bacterium]|nr:DUF2231 domain-containing protein [Azospirillaceae bacterium]
MPTEIPPPEQLSPQTVQRTPVIIRGTDRAVVVTRLPLYPLFAPFPGACFVGAFLTDVAYWQTAEMMWADFSAWLLFAGVVLGAVALLIGLVDLAGRRFVDSQAHAWPHALGVLVVLGLGILNCFVHSRDAWTSVVPQGLILSALTVVILLTTAWLGWAVINTRRVEVLS